MDESRFRRINELFHKIVALPFAERSAALDEECAADRELRESVERMVAADAKDDLFMEPLGLEEAPRKGIDRACAPGTILGAYRIGRRLGSGGMGDVYLAERADGRFRREAAIKVLKRGMDTDELLRRFDLERAVLAELNHDGIARLLDAGTLPDGRPFLVMEYVEGRPIDVDCDERRLTIEQRLHLFLRVCDAVDHAHRRLVVHLDLKPANILVGPDGHPRLLDFGVAKLISDRRSEVTVAGMLRPLTLDYASPEQVDGRSVSTVTDVYTLGIILHELLTGERPLSADDEPPRPSNAATTGASVVERSRRRRTTPTALARRLTSDLDNIVRMAMHPDPSRRYPSVDHFAADIRRHLEGHPVVARNPTFVDRASKFVRRNRVVVMLASAVVLSVLSGLIGLLWKATEAARARDAAERERIRAETVVEFLQETLSAASPRRGGLDLTVASALEQAAQEVASRFGDDADLREQVHQTIGKTLLELGRLDAAVEQFTALLASREARLPDHDARVVEAIRGLGIALYANDDAEGASQYLSRALAILRDGGPSDALSQTLNDLAVTRSAAEEYDEAKALYQEAIVLRRKLHGEESLEVAETLNNLASTLRLEGENDVAERYLRRSFAIRATLLDPDHPLRIQSASNLAVLLMTQGKLDDAEPLIVSAIESNRRVLGNDHPDLATDLSTLASLCYMRGNYEDEKVAVTEAYRIRRSVLPPESAKLAITRLRLGEMFLKEGNPEGKELVRKAHAVLVAQLGADHPYVTRACRAMESASAP